MILSRRRRADRLSSAALLCLTVGLCGAAWLALKRPAPVEPFRMPAGAQPAPPAPPVAPSPALPENLSILWPNAAAAASSKLFSAPGFAPSEADTPSFTIRGLIGSLSGPSSCAFIQTSAGQTMVRQGEVADGWTLTAVKGNSATFARNGREVTLNLAKPEYEAGTGTMPGAASARATIGSPSQPRAVPVVVPSQQPPAPQSATSASVAAAPASAGSAAKKADATISVPRSVAEMVRTNPGAAMQGLQLEPYMSNGQLQGFTVTSVADNAVAAPYVAQGDHILAVNGTPINSMSSAMNIYQQLVNSGSTSVTVTIERGGKQQDVAYTVK